MNTPLNPRRRAAAICFHQEKLLIVRMRDPDSGITYPFPPGGGIEPGEQPARTAEREALEETGYSVQALPTPPQILKYEFPWAGKLVHCETQFFHTALVATSPVAPAWDDFRIRVEWLPISRIATEFSFHEGIRNCCLKWFPVQED